MQTKWKVNTKISVLTYESKIYGCKLQFFFSFFIINLYRLCKDCKPKMDSVNYKIQKK